MKTFENTAPLLFQTKINWTVSTLFSSSFITLNSYKHFEKHIMCALSSAIHHQSCTWKYFCKTNSRYSHKFSQNLAGHSTFRTIYTWDFSHCYLWHNFSSNWNSSNICLYRFIGYWDSSPDFPHHQSPQHLSQSVAAQKHCSFPTIHNRNHILQRFVQLLSDVIFTVGVFESKVKPVSRFEHLQAIWCSRTSKISTLPVNIDVNVPFKFVLQVISSAGNRLAVGHNPRNGISLVLQIFFCGHFVISLLFYYFGIGVVYVGIQSVRHCPVIKISQNEFNVARVCVKTQWSFPVHKHVPLTALPLE